MLRSDFLKNALTIDLEDWYQTEDLNLDTKYWPNYESRIESSTKNILDILSEKNIKATFFVLGYIAKNHPLLIREISDLGHEIGSHGYWHRMINKMSRQEFRNEIVNSKSMLEDITGKSVEFFRAPTWSIGSGNLWALEILEEEGFICDSSIQPFVTPLSGMRGALVYPFYPVVNGKKLEILEFPSTVLKMGGCSIPFSGGFYMRLLPYSFISYALKNINKKRAGMIYIHPWETDIDQPRICKTPFCRLTHYYNLKTTLHKLKNLLDNFEFTSLGELVNDKTFPVVDIVNKRLTAL